MRVTFLVFQFESAGPNGQLPYGTFLNDTGGLSMGTKDVLCRSFSLPYDILLPALSDLYQTRTDSALFLRFPLVQSARRVQLHRH